MWIIWRWALDPELDYLWSTFIIKNYYTYHLAWHDNNQSYVSKGHISKYPKNEQKKPLWIFVWYNNQRAEWNC